MHCLNRSKRCRRLLLAALCLATLLAVSPQVRGVDWSARELQFRERFEPLLQSACVDCHSGEEASGGLAIDHFPTAESMMKERHTFEKVLARLRIGDMPPADSTPLDNDQRAKLIEWLDGLLHEVDCGGQPNPGKVTLRRLTRSEYRYAVRDLLWVDYEEAEDFPGDDVGYGFDNIGDVLNLPPLLMEKYIAAAEQITAEAIRLPEPGPTVSNAYSLDRFKLAGGKGRVAADQISMHSNDSITFEETVPWSGVFHLELIAGGTPARGGGPEFAISLDGKPIAKRSVAAGKGKDESFDIPLRLKAGKHSLQIAFTNDLYVKGENGEPNEDRNLSIFGVRFYGAKPQPPMSMSDVPPSHRRIITATPSAFVSVDAAMRKVVSPLIVYLYRRPVSEEELSRIVALGVSAVDEGESFEGGVQLVLQAMLLSPHFLFKLEQPAGNIEQHPPVSDFELASRLSFFLWNTPPDQELFTLAWQKKLRDPQVLRQQFDRLIADPKAARFVDSFAGQWLTLRKLKDFEADKNFFPSWSEDVRDLARQETLLFVSDVFRNDRSVLELLDADYTFLNDRLAKYYGVAGVTGSEFRKVSVRSLPRRGLLTHASILAVTSNPTRTSPVKRGRFILDNILNTPPPPPPPGVPELEKTKLTGSLREQIEQHRADPACAGCHKLMDPLGLALENFDAVGRWRTDDRGEAIDASGTLPGGESVRHAGDLINILRDKHGEQFARCLTEKLMTYALGRGLEYYDRCAIDKILADAAEQDYRFSAIALGIITSDPFQRKGTREAL